MRDTPSRCLASNLILLTDNKKRYRLEAYSKGQFYKNTVYLERCMLYFVFVSTNAVLAKKNR